MLSNAISAGRILLSAKALLWLFVLSVAGVTPADGLSLHSGFLLEETSDGEDEDPQDPGGSGEGGEGEEKKKTRRPPKPRKKPDDPPPPPNDPPPLPPPAHAVGLFRPETPSAVVVTQAPNYPANPPENPPVGWNARNVAFCLDPLVTFNGQFRRSESLFALEGAGDLDLALALIYDCNWDSNDDLLAPFWHLSVLHKLEVRKTQSGQLLYGIFSPGGATHEALVPGNQPGLLEGWFGSFSKLQACTTGSCSYVLRQADGLEIGFGPTTDRPLANGVLQEVAEVQWIRDRHGNQIQYTYGSDRRLASITQALGSITTFTYYTAQDVQAGLTAAVNEGKLKQAIDPTGRTWTLEYDASEDLVALLSPPTEHWDPALSANEANAPFQVSNSPLRKSYTYAGGNLSGEHYLERYYAPGNSLLPALENTWGDDETDPQHHGRILEQRFQGSTSTLFYQDVDPGNALLLRPFDPKSKVLIIDRNQHARLGSYNSRGRLLQLTLFSGTFPASNIPRGGDLDQITASWPMAISTSHNYDVDGNRTQSVFAEGNWEEFLFDVSHADRFRHGNLLQSTLHPGPRGDGLGGSVPPQVWTYEYDPIFNQQLRVVDPRGNDSSYVAASGGVHSADRYAVQQFVDYQESTAYSPTMLQLAIDWEIYPDSSLLLGVDLNGDGVTAEESGNIVRTQLPDARIPDPSQPGTMTLQSGLLSEQRWNSRGQITWSRNARGTETDYQYQDNPGLPEFGRLVRCVQDPAGIQATTDFGYDPLGRLSQVTGPRGIVAEITYTNLGEVKEVREAASIDPLRGETGLSPIPEQASQYYYDAEGNLIRSQARALRDVGILDWTLSLYEYDNFWNLARWVETIDNGAGGYSTRSTRYEYDAEDRLYRVRTPVSEGAAPGSADACNTVTVHRYPDARGLAGQLVRAAGSADQSVHSFEYDGNANVVAMYDAADNGQGVTPFVGCGGYLVDGDLSQTLYDGFDRPVQQLGPLGDLGAVGYDPAGRVVAESFRGRIDGPTSAIELLSQSRYSYDELGRAYRVEDDYFGPGEVPILSDGNSDGIVDLWIYRDRHGNPVAWKDDQGAVTTLAYDALDRLVGAVDPVGNSESLQFDPAGNLILLSRTEVASTGTATASLSFAVRYNALNQATQRMDHEGRTWSIVPDFAGRPLYLADPNGPAGGSPLPGLPATLTPNLPGNVTALRYDLLGRVTREDHFLTSSGLGDGQIPPLGSTLVSLHNLYDDNDRVQQRIDGNGHSSFWEFDARNQPVIQRGHDGTESTFEYDADSNQVFSSYPDGTSLQQVYDAANRPVSMQTLAAADNTRPVQRQVRYDGLGRVRYTEEVQEVGPLGPQKLVVQRAFDSLDNLRTEQSFAGALPLGFMQSSFDGVGNRRSLTTTDGTSYTYQSDLGGRLQLIFQNSLPIAAYEYLGYRLTQRDRLTSSGTLLRSTASYNSVPKVTGWRHEKVGSGVLADLLTQHDRLGQRLNEVRLDASPATTGNVVRRDSLYRMTEFLRSVPDAVAEVQTPGSGGAPADHYSYDFDAAQNRLQARNNSGTVPSVPNSLNQLTSVQGVATRYDGRGNFLGLTSSGSPSYAYDALNRMSAYSVNGKTSYLLHDSFRRVHGKAQFDDATGALESLEFTQHDRLRPIAEQRFDSSGSVTSRQLTYGRGLDELLQVDHSVHGSLYPLTNFLGSTFELLDSQGNLVEKYEDLDGFGSLQVSNPAGQPLSQSAYDYREIFSGARWLADVPLHQMRNRELNSTLGRFQTKDPAGDHADPLGLSNGYTALGNNPQAIKDPLGFWGWLEDLIEGVGNGIKAVGEGVAELGMIVHDSGYVITTTVAVEVFDAEVPADWESGLRSRTFGAATQRIRAGEDSTRVALTTGGEIFVSPVTGAVEGVTILGEGIWEGDFKKIGEGGFTTALTFGTGRGQLRNGGGYRGGGRGFRSRGGGGGGRTPRIVRPRRSRTRGTDLGPALQEALLGGRIRGFEPTFTPRPVYAPAPPVVRLFRGEPKRPSNWRSTWRDREAFIRGLHHEGRHTLKTPETGTTRYVDSGSLRSRVLREVKEGRVSGDKSFWREFTADLELRRAGFRIEWHFFENWKGKGGPTGPVRDMLLNNGITIYIWDRYGRLIRVERPRAGLCR